ncbi:hypothetical protein NP493_46g07044 [Ridgeia piscesae]|uniref:Uncharacterized protein n=1 Tax=Ridgeia piscesae TaxID=27915 RepID=A0AAD9UJQ3_RIDPI|nr:hypothetical protein NP493_46g07044 [Ridgeia piscesae]
MLWGSLLAITFWQMKSVRVGSSSPMYSTIFLFTHGFILLSIRTPSTIVQSSPYANSSFLPVGIFSMRFLMHFLFSSAVVGFLTAATAAAAATAALRGSFMCTWLPA